MRDGLLFGAGSKAYRDAVDLPPRAAAVMEELRPGVTAARSVGDVGRSVAAAWRTRPLGTAELVGAKAARSWYATDSARHERVLLPLQLAYLALAALGGAVAWRMGGASRALALGVAAVVVYFWAMTVLVLSIVRYMVPAMALLFLLLPGLMADEHDARLRREPDRRDACPVQEHRLAERDRGRDAARRVREHAAALPLARVDLPRARAARGRCEPGGGIEAREPAERRAEVGLEAGPPRREAVQLPDVREALLREEIARQDVVALRRVADRAVPARGTG
jgi:hypothetical protein